MNESVTRREKTATGKGEEIARIGDTLTRMRLLIRRRIIGRMAIANVVPGLDVSHLDVLDVMKRIDKAGGEATVGAIAEAMRIDPSRGSRMVAELVTRGVVRRTASQADGRRSLIERTELGERLISEVRAVKQSLLMDVLEDWPAEDVAAFSVLFEKFVTRFEAVHLTGDRSES
ncbi:MarR family winged helix-turn-helix transcriptional regulator [Rhizobium sp. LCM 4573]|uniref:MarR family winged helix-turn-helix transcriptional regulator n=1 Tax=Rhizobium sp. LCM 4573 TaxID=1848291 RepID=UPI0008D91F2A|nr:MarR family transcriptional regulator [Rhizobium sp. LCM 4573]OHV76013.1 MarR family transcriptional regulator [Rhizobium sp. LCM 4573]